MAHPTNRKWVITLVNGISSGNVHWKDWGELPHLRSVGWTTKYKHHRNHDLPSGKLSHNYGKSPFSINGITHYKWQFSIAMLNYQREFVIFLLFQEAPRMRHIGNQPNNTNQMCGSESFSTLCLFVNKPVIARHVCKSRPIRIREWFPLHDLHTLRYWNLAEK